MDDFVIWRYRDSRELRDEDVRVDWGTYSDGGDYWEVWIREPTDVEPA
jgi:hypothetical protein